MTLIRNSIKRHLPRRWRSSIQDMRRNIMRAPLVEDENLHGYDIVRDQSGAPRLSLVIPTIAADAAFGGVLTGLDFFFSIGVRAGCDLRIVLDDLSHNPDLSILYQRAKAFKVEPSSIEVEVRRKKLPTLSVRRSDVFLAFNWWTALNIQSVIEQQSEMYSNKLLPYIYLIQDYEPNFYPFSSTHMMAMLAQDNRRPYWAIYNTSELQEYTKRQGHRPEMSFVFQPKIADGMRSAMASGPCRKEKRILIYGRPTIPRNCFPAICGGLRSWIENDPEQPEWDIVSAGTPHKPIPLALGRHIKSVGMLPLHDYARLLQTTAVGISLMSSPHPSYPPYEMAHFGVVTITNRYANKDLSQAHDNIVSLPDISHETIGREIGIACRRFSSCPDAGWQACSHIPWFLRDEPFECIDEIVDALRKRIWAV